MKGETYVGVTNESDVKVHRVDGFSLYGYGHKGKGSRNKSKGLTRTMAKLQLESDFPESSPMCKKVD